MFDSKDEVFKEVDPKIFEKIREEGGGKLFAIGDEFNLNGVAMRIRKITKKDILLRRVKNQGAT